jgi:tRNA(fMet)-specific endonuclease VapC
MYLLDTNILIDILRNSDSPALKRLIHLSPDKVAVSAITMAELEYGVYKSSNPALNAQRLIQACTPLTILSFDNEAAAAYGLIRAQLEAKGTPIGPMDTLIAAHALSMKATLVTNNLREFKRIKNLRVENWLKHR